MAHLEYSGLNFSDSSLVILPDIAKLKRNHQERLLLVAWKRKIMSVMQNY